MNEYLNILLAITISQEARGIGNPPIKLTEI